MSEAGFQSYSLSPAGDLIARHQRLRAALDRLHYPYTQERPYALRLLDPDLSDNPQAIEAATIEAWRTLEGSPLYAAYTDQDRHEAMRYVHRITQSERRPEWSVEGRHTKDDRIFVGADIERRVAAQPSDLGILTGYGAIDLFELEPGCLSPANYSSQGFKSLLHYAQFLAACSAERLNLRRDPQREASYMTRIGHSVGRLVIVTADTHGDLNISASEHYALGAIDMLGVRQKFAPDRVGETKLSARQGSESGVLLTLMKWAKSINLPEKVQRRYFTNAVYEALQVKDQEGVNEFSAEKYIRDFESCSVLGINGLVKEETEAPIACQPHDQDYIVLGSQRVFGTDQMLRSYLRRSDNSLLMRVDDGTIPREDDGIPQIVFPPEEMYLLTRALVEQTKRGVGRTPFVTMVGMIGCRFLPDFRD